MKTTFCHGFVEMPYASRADKILIAHGEEPDGTPYQASCRCGWEGPLRCDVDQARVDIAAHLAEAPREAK